MIEKLDALKILGDGPNPIKKYLNYIATDSDDYISGGAICQLIELNLVDANNENLLLSHLHIPCIRRLAVSHFSANGQSHKVELATANEKKAPIFEHDKCLQFITNQDTKDWIESEANLFFESGQLDHIFKIITYARKLGGERCALPWLIRATLLAPSYPNALFKTLKFLEIIDDQKELENLTKKLISWNVHALAAKIFLAQILLNKGELSKFNKVILSIPMDRLEQWMKSKLHGLIAKAKEIEGNFKEASEHYLQQNNPDKPNSQEQRDYFINTIRVTETLRFEGEVPPASNHFMMLGFPRSGTTLLENALSSHPEIETLEETPAFSSMRRNLLSAFHLPISTKRQVNSEAWRNATQIYYDHIQLCSNKKDASVYIDKLPLNTAFAGLLSRCFPDKRYIFSIRHPYDVVLSCYKQPFADNPAMEHFKRFEDACALYDFVMKRWFTFFKDDDPRVCYVKYDALVNNFQHETSRVLKFINLQWNDEILNFAENANQRAALTPSYAKVRQGLSLGVQSSWERYHFLYDDINRKYLDFWVEKFGYNVK